MEEAQSWQTNGDESRANNGLSFCQDAKLPFVFLLLVPSWRLEAGRNVQSPDMRQVGPAKTLPWQVS